MATVVLTVPNISCAHCEHTITSTLTALPGVQRVQVNIPAKQVQVAYNEQLVTVPRAQHASAGGGLSGRLDLASIGHLAELNA